MVKTATQSHSTDEAHPQSFALITFFAEFNKRRLLMITTKRTNILFPLR